MSEIIANLIAKNRALEKRLNYLETQENGSGGGDADTVDGYHASAFGLLGSANTWTQNNYFAANVGIGTTSPSYPLHVNGSIAIDGTNYLYMKKSSSSSLALVLAVSGVLSDATVLQSAGGGVTLRKADGTSVLTATEGGNVGIGTTTPDVHLVAYSNSTNPAIKVEAGASGSFPLYQLVDGRVGGVNWNIEDGRVAGVFGIYQSGGGTRLAIDTSGQVGVNTTSPVATLGISPTIAYGIAEQDMLAFHPSLSGGTTSNQTSLGALLWSNATGANKFGRINVAMDNPSAVWRSHMSFWTNGGGGGTDLTEKMRLTYDGRLGVGTTTPNVQGIEIKHSTSPAMRLAYADTYGWQLSNNNVDAAFRLQYMAGNSVYATSLRADYTGSVSIGSDTAASSGYKLEVFGAIKQSSFTYQATTDARYYINAGGTLRFLDASSSYNLKLGIGTTPQRQLHVYGAGSVLAIDAPATSDSDIDFFSAGAVKSSIYRPANTNDLRVWTNSGGDIVTFGYSSGNVGIGTTNPQGRIHAYNGYGGFMFVSRTSVSTVAQTIIQNGTGDVTKAVLVVGYIRDSGGTYTNLNTRINNGGTVLLGSFGMDVASDGTFTIYSTSGSLTFDFHAICIWS